MPAPLLQSEKTRLRRHPERGSYDRDLVHAILDEALVCHAALSDETEKRAALLALVNHVLAGRAGEVREPSTAELRATLVVAVPISEASAKVRTGPPLDSPEDLALPTWAGVLPLALAPGAPEPDPTLAPSVPLPDSVRGYLRQRRRPSAASPTSDSAAASQSSPPAAPAES